MKNLLCILNMNCCVISLQSALAIKTSSLVCDLTSVALDILCQMSNLLDKSYLAFRVLMAAGKSLLGTCIDYIPLLTHMEANFLCFNSFLWSFSRAFLEPLTFFLPG